MKPPIDQFGGAHTRRKQSVVIGYLRAYVRALGGKFHLSYVDAFAGSGRRIDAGIRTSPDTDLFQPTFPPTRDSTAIEALRLRPSFERYRLGDKSRQKVEALQAIIDREREQDPGMPRPLYFVGDANTLVAEECAWLAQMPRGRRAVMFLDPYGMQVSWTTLQTIQACPQIDLWLLLPTGIAANRLIPNQGIAPLLWQARLDDFFGTPSWRDAMTATTADLYGNLTVRRVRDVTGLIAFTMRRLGQLFGDGLLPRPLELRAKGKPAYHLVFATTSRSPRAREIAHRIAGHLIGKHQAGS